jgi:benzoyl-CoA 2,3-epoxidase subunit B
MDVDLACSIPNNVGLAERPALRRQLEWFDGRFRQWWRDWGPLGIRDQEVYLRTPVGVDAAGWAQYRFIPFSAYRWGVFEMPAKPDRRILFGACAGDATWQSVPDEHRATIRRHLVTQGDTEPGSVEQSFRLAASAPSLYDLRNLLQFHVEEGRHLWAMAHLLFEHFGGAGEDEALGLLSRRSGDAHHPRILDAFNHPVEDWLSFFMWCFLADRDGKYQLLSVADSAFDPLARTVQFMLTEEAHHMFIGEDGLRRVVQRTLDFMKEHDTDDVRPHGGINLAQIQRYFNLWAPRIYDLFGNDESKRAADLFDAGFRSRVHEASFDEHVRLDAPITVERRSEDGFIAVDVPTRSALNGAMRLTYLKEVDQLLGRLNRMIQRAGIRHVLALPSPRFNRRFGVYAGELFSPSGDRISAETFAANQDSWLPTVADRTYLASIMTPVRSRAKIANWIAPPQRGTNNQAALDFDYVRL